MCQKSQKPNEPFLRKTDVRHTPKTSLFHKFLREIQPILESCDWLKNPAIWLAKSILGHISGSRIFPNMKLVQAYNNYSNITFIIDQIEKKLKNWKKNLNLPIHSKNPRLGLFSPFWGQIIIFKKIWLCHAQHHMGTWHHIDFQKKTKEPIPRKHPNRRTDRPYSYNPSGHGQGSYKRISQLRGIAVDDKNKIQYNSA